MSAKGEEEGPTQGTTMTNPTEGDDIGPPPLMSPTVGTPSVPAFGITTPLKSAWKPKVPTMGGIEEIGEQQ